MPFPTPVVPRLRAPSREALALALLCAAQFVVVLDVTVVSVALPSIRADLGLGATGAHWVVSAYAVAFAAALLAGGRAADVVGRRRTFVAGFALFTASSLAAGVADGPNSLVAARTAQGLGAALLSPAAFALLAWAYPDGPRRARALSTWTAVAGTAAVTGMAGGGALVDLVSWRWIFLVNVPVGFLALAAAPRLLDGAAPEAGRRLDLGTVVLVTGGLVAIVEAISRAGASRRPGEALVAAGVGLVLVAAAALRDRRARDPFLPRAVLAYRGAVTVNAAGLVYGGLMLSGFLLLTLAMQVALGWSPAAAGAGLVAARVAGIACSRPAAAAVARLGTWPVLASGMALTAAAHVSFARLDPGASYTTSLLPGLVLLGAGIPMLFVSTSSLVVGGVPAGHAGTGSGLLSTLQWLGGAIGVALVPAVQAADPDALATVRHGFAACAAVAVVGLLLALLGGARRRSRVGHCATATSWRGATGSRPVAAPGTAASRRP
jgi:EmrB/QacA subfamily drug resistance transporter